MERVEPELTEKNWLKRYFMQNHPLKLNVYQGTYHAQNSEHHGTQLK